MFNPEKETLPREKLEKLQIAQFKKTLKYLKNSRSKLKEKYKHVEPEDITSLEDLKTYPLLQKMNLKTVILSITLLLIRPVVQECI